MPALPSSNPKQFVQGAPVLHVPDVAATARFYRDVLDSRGILVTKHTRSFGGTTPRFTSLRTWIAREASTSFNG
jgi:hypothetical protein